MINAFSVLCACLLLTSSCTQHQRQQPQQMHVNNYNSGAIRSQITVKNTDTAEVLPDSVLHALWYAATIFHTHPFGFEVSRDIAAHMVQRFGTPLSIMADTSQYEHDKDQIDSVYTYAFDGITLKIMHVTKWNYNLPMSIEVFSSNCSFADTNISVGRSTQYIQACFGRPHKTGKDYLYYEVEVGNMYFYHANQKVTKIMLEYYTSM